jgi:HemY protein
VTGRLDAFQWQRPLAALPSDKNAAIEAKEFNEAISASRRVEPPRDVPIEPAAPAEQDNSPALAAAVEPALVAPPAPPQPEPAPAAPLPPTRQPESSPAPPGPLFRARQDIPKNTPSSILPVIPIVRAPDDPGIDDEAGSDEFAEQINPAPGQAGGWRGFLSRWGG